MNITHDTTFREQFLEQGYVVVENAIDPATLQALHDDYAETLDRMATIWHKEGILPQTFAGLPFYERISAVVQYLSDRDYLHFDIALPHGRQLTEDVPIHLSEAVFRLLTHPTLLDHVEALIGPEIIINPIQHVRIKPPENTLQATKPSGLTKKTGWHQDMGVARPEADETEMITVWVAISDATEENGCLAVIPRSYHSGLTLHCPTVGVTIPDNLLEPQVTPVPMKAGSALFMHRLTKHSSLSNVSDTIRWSFDLRYQPAGQPSGRDEFPATLARSHRNPEAVVTNWRDWADAWLDARRQLSDEYHQTRTHRWSSDDPGCA